MSQRKIKVPKLELRAAFKPESFDAEKRTIDVVFTTGARGKRYSWSGPFYEELAVDKKSVRLERLNAGAPVLNSHGSAGMFHPGRGLRDIMGVVERAKIVGKEGVATLRFSEREDIQDLVRDIQTGIIRNVSVGYQVHKFEEMDPAEDGTPVLRAVDWEPYEVSFVAMPFDMGAQARSHIEAEAQEVSVQSKQENDMPKTKTRTSEEQPAAAPEAEPVAVQEGDEPQGVVESPAAPEAAPAAPAAEEPKPEVAPAAPAAEEPAPASEGERGAVDPEAIRLQEVERQSQIRSAVRFARLEEDFADKLVKERVSVKEARSLIFEELEKRTNKPTKNQRVEVRDMDQIQLRREAAVRALLHRFDAGKYKLQEGDREFRQGSLIDVARKYLHMEGEANAWNLSRQEVARRALHSTSDFPEVLANIANKSLRDAYEGAPNTYAPLVRQKNVSDFKEISSVQLGNGGKLQKVGEHGEYKRTTIEESAEKYAVEKFGLIVGRTFELMVNDDLDAFTRIPAQLGVRAREKENETFWGLVIANGLMSDGVAYFAAGHGNLTGVGTAISVASLGVARKLMRLQTDLEGELMNLNPSYLIVPAALETVAEQFVAQIQPDASGNVNPFAGRLRIIVEPRLDASSAVSWYAAAAREQLAAGEMALLDGAGPEMSVREGFEVDGAELKIRYIFGMKLIEHRAMYKNVGA